MGIPKLFKILSERYPSLSQVVPANQLPQYDYLYIDLNNLIHKALSERNLLPLEQLDDEFYLEERIFERILCYIETIHRIIPSKVLFLSIDGVAPRAKWATQRERRLRENKLQTQFDTNAISPGTKFMVNLETALMEFLSNKIKHHANWQNCEIYVSGSNCPGEGSIKIIEFIRSLKQSEESVSDQKHCIYSGDNDFLLLGIATHELYISLIHEKKRSATSLAALCLDDIKHQFEVIHFETLRQYLRMEFVECQNKMSFGFNMDNVCNDWVVLMTLLGNDYVPGLPNFNLDHNVLTTIYDAYKGVLTSSNGYINEHGFLNLSRFARLIENLKSKDFDLYCNNRRNLFEPITEKMSEINLNNNNNNNNDSYVDDTKSSTRSNFRYSDFLEMKDQHYTQRLGDKKLPDYAKMSASYAKMMQWILFYYYRDTCSWTEYYPHDFVPFVSDFADIHKASLSLGVDKPMKIFTHLLAILPKRSAHLMPRCYQMEMFDDVKIPHLNDLLEKSSRVETRLLPEDEQRNIERSMRKLRFVGTGKSSNCVQVTEFFGEKKSDRTEKTVVHRPFNREDFNFQFSTLNLHDYSFKLVEPSGSKPYSRWIICLKTNQLSDDAVVESDTLMNQPVYINWPHYTEAKVVQIFDANKKVWQSNGETKITDNSPEFIACVDQLNSRHSENGIDVGEIKLVAYVALLKWVEYKPSETHPNAYELVKHWDDKKWVPVAVQSLIRSFMPETRPQFKSVNDVLCAKNVVLFSAKSQYFGEIATIVDSQSLETNGRVCIVAYMEQAPHFEKAISVHTATKAKNLNEFKQLSTAATLLGITEKVFARITGCVLVSNDDDCIRKINIGLQLKLRGLYNSSMLVAHNYVKKNGKQFVYSQSTIDLVQQYMDKFPRVFELLNSSQSMRLSEFGHSDKNAREYLTEIQTWLQSLPHNKERRTSVEAMHLSSDAIKHVQRATHATYGVDAKVLRFKKKWQDLYIPDLNNAFVVPYPNASYKLLDRVLVVRSGYPISVGTKGTIVGIEPALNYIPGTEITENELYALDILMDHSYKVPLAADEFKRHKIFRTRSTNMLINISHGRDT